MNEVVIIIEGLRDELARHLFNSLKYIYQEKKSLVSYLEFEGLGISLLNPNYNGSSPNELKCRDSFIKLLKTNRIILVNDIDHKREEYFTSEFSLDTKYILIVSETEDTTHSAISTDHKTGLTTYYPVNTMYIYRNCKNYKEKLIVLISNIKKTILSCNKLRIVHKLFLLTRFTSLAVISNGFSILYTVDTPAVFVLRDLLQSIKNKCILFIYTGQRVYSLLQAHGIQEIVKIKNRKNLLSERTKPESISHLKITEVEKSIELKELVSKVLSKEKVMVLVDAQTAKSMIKYIKKDDKDVRIGDRVLVRLTVNGIEVTEKRYPV